MRLGKSVLVCYRKHKFPRYYRPSDIENLDYNSLFQIERGGKKEMIRRKGISYRGISFESKISKISVMIIFQSEGRGEGEGDVQMREKMEHWVGCYWIIARIMKMEIRVEMFSVGNVGKYFLERRLSGLA